MIIENTEALEIVLSEAASTQVTWEAGIAIANGGTYVQSSSEYGTTNNTTAVTMVTGEASQQKRVISISIYNADSIAHTVTIRRTSTQIIRRVTIQAGYSIHYTNGSSWHVYNSNGEALTTGTPGQNGADGSDGALSVSEAEVDFGASPVYDKSFTITDASVAASSKIIAVQSGSAATGRDADENELDSLILRCVPASGSFTVYAKAIPGPVSGKYKINYQFS